MYKHDFEWSNNLCTCNINTDYNYNEDELQLTEYPESVVRDNKQLRQGL